MHTSKELTPGDPAQTLQEARNARKFVEDLTGAT